MTSVLMCKFYVITNMISLSLGHFLSHHPHIVKKVAKQQAKDTPDNIKFVHQNLRHTVAIDLVIDLSLHN